MKNIYSWSVNKTEYSHSLVLMTSAWVHWSLQITFHLNWTTNWQDKICTRVRNFFQKLIGNWIWNLKKPKYEIGNWIELDKFSETHPHLIYCYFYTNSRYSHKTPFSEWFIFTLKFPFLAEGILGEIKFDSNSISNNLEKNWKNLKNQIENWIGLANFQLNLIFQFKLELWSGH